MPINDFSMMEWLNFAHDWDVATDRLKRSGVDLDSIILTEDLSGDDADD